MLDSSVSTHYIGLLNHNMSSKKTRKSYRHEARAENNDWVEIESARVSNEQGIIAGIRSTRQ